MIAQPVTDLIVERHYTAHLERKIPEVIIILIGIPLVIWRTIVDGMDWWAFITQILIAIPIISFGVTGVQHRLITHRAYKVKSRRFKRWLFRLASCSIEGSIIKWAANHTKHHYYSDRPGDLHSPWVGFKHDNWWHIFRGWFFAHMGWLYENNHNADRTKYAAILLKDPDAVRVDREFPFWAVFSLVLAPAVLSGGLFVPFHHLGFDLNSAIDGIAWGFFRAFIVLNITWCINSFTHFEALGERVFIYWLNLDHSCNISGANKGLWKKLLGYVLEFLTLGESNHGNHHAFADSAFQGILKGQRDITGRILYWFEQKGWIEDVKRPSLWRLIELSRDPDIGSKVKPEYVNMEDKTPPERPQREERVALAV